MLQYIEKLFQETKTIILPGLGALTITNPDTKELMFMPFLKHDDGALSGFIEKEAGISGEEAKKMVSDEVSAILNDLEAGKAVPFGNFGSFNKEADGDIAFENGGSDAQPAAAETPDTSKAEEEADAKKAADAEAKKKAKKEADAKIAADAEAKKKAQEEADAKIAADAEAKKKAQEEADAKKAADAEAKKKAQEEADAKKAAEAEAKKKAQEEADAKIAADAEAKKKAQEEADAKKAADAEAKKKEEASKKNIVVPPVVPVSEQPKSTRSTVNEVIPDNVGSKDSAKEKNILEKEEIAANQKKLNDLKEQKNEPKKKRKRGVGFYILMVLLVLLISGGTLVALNYDKAKEYLPFLGEETAAVSDGDEEMDKLDELVGGNEQDKEETSSAEENVENENSEDENTADEESENEPDVAEETPEVVAPTPDPEPTPQVTGSNNQPFHIIAGAFGDPANADRMVEKLKGMGYPSKTISRGAQTLVSVQSYATRSAAQTALSSVSDAAPSGWVLEWR